MEDPGILGLEMYASNVAFLCQPTCSANNDQQHLYNTITLYSAEIKTGLKIEHAPNLQVLLAF